MIHSSQINVGGVFEDDETLHVFLVDEINIPVLLLRSRGAAQLGFEVAALDPPGHRVRVNSQRLRETAGGIEAPVVLETHSFQLEVDSGGGSGVPGSLQLHTDALVAHPRIPGQNLQFPLAPRQLFGSGQTQLTSALLQSPMRHADFLCQQPDARARLRLRRAEVDFSDEMVDLVAEDVLAAALGFTSTTIVAVDCGRTNRSSLVYA